MKTFIYVYKTPDSRVITKKLKANSFEDAQNFLQKKNIIPLSLKNEKTTLWEILTRPSHVDDNDLVAFTQLFAGCIQSGLNIKDSLQLLSKQMKNRLLKDAISEIIISIESGTSISDSFSKHTKIFPKFFPMILKAGEASGDLSTVLDYIGNFLEKISNIKKQIIGIITYPLIVGTVGIGLLILILMFVAPTFKDVFLESGKELPLPTVILFKSSDFIIEYNTAILTCITSLVIIYQFIKRSVKGKYLIDSLIIFTPISGNIAKQIIMLRFLGCFDILVNSDVPITQALVVLEDAATNIRIKNIITDIRKDVARGLPIAGPLIENKRIIPEIVSYSISMGEKSGNLGASLSRINTFMDKELTFNMKKLSSKLDPILTGLIGGIVLFIALAIYLPIFDLMAL